MAEKYIPRLKEAYNKDYVKALEKDLKIDCNL